MQKKVAVVTGGGSGIGKAACELLAQKDYRVVVSDLNEVTATEVANDIRENGGEAIAIKTNVGKYEEVEQLMKSAHDQYGSLDLLVNNAGIGPRNMAKTADSTLEDWNLVIAVNQSGVFYGMKTAIPYMMEQKQGNIVNIASLAGLKAAGNTISYSASKFAVVGMTKSAALEYGKHNIRINAVCPGYTQTQLLDQLFGAKPDLEPTLRSFIPMGRYGTSNEIAEAIYWLASDQSSFVTGHTLVLDGGLGL